MSKIKKTAKDAKKSVTRYIVTCVDNGECCDGKPQVLRVCKSLKSARSFVESDIANYEEMGAENCDTERMSCDICEWNIQKVDIPL